MERLELSLRRQPRVHELRRVVKVWVGKEGVRRDLSLAGIGKCRQSVLMASTASGADRWAILGIEVVVFFN